MATKKYKKAKIYTGKDGSLKNKWFVYYSFLNPFTASFERFKVYEGINMIKDLKDRTRFANDLVDEINARLIAGYDPFKAELATNKLIFEKETEILLEESRKTPTLLEGLNTFLEVKKKKNLAKDTLVAYTSYIGKFENYLLENKLADVRLNGMDTRFISDMLDWLTVEHKWGETTFNNHLAFWVNLLNWFARSPRKWLRREDFEIGADRDLEFKVAKVMKNQYFGANVAEKVKKEMENFPKLLFYSQFIYYSCMRPEEIRQLKIENVDIEGRYIKIVGKTSSRTIPISDELAEMLKSLNLQNYPSNYHVIGKAGEVSDRTHGENYFAKMFHEHIRPKLKLSMDFTLYGWKHTRVVDLLNAGYSDAEIMGLTGHRDTSSYDKYKRDLIGNLSNNKLRGKTIGW
ncbi:tyrosine-type recombinase/integrase [Pedobacter agri]|uniref:Site-specific integrase n=1 Tax=Pedobacter agri TaxID=454586 RepID=A0A9X3DCL0_9SPHI|nr:site-specific integrase [Pedobacter agri]MCX3264832.1 site-specific integrase [Pedobacter agri]